MNAYFVHMLERAREVHEINKGETHRESVVKCPFCIADEDEQWHIQKSFGFKPPGERPKRMAAPHCTYCPLQSMFGGTDLLRIMDNCVEMGFYALRGWEDSDEEDRNYNG